MDKFWTVAKREYLERVRTKWFLITTILAPLLFGGIVLLPVWFNTRGRPSADVSRILVLDASHSGLGQRIAKELNGGLFGDTSLTHLVAVAPGALARAESTATQEVMHNSVEGYLAIGPDVLTSLHMQYAGRNASSAVDMDALERTVRNQLMALRLERAGVERSQAAALSTLKLTLDADRITDKGRGGSGTVNSIFAFIVAFVLYIAIFLYGQNVLRGVVEEKQSHVAEVVVSSISATKLLWGKVIGVGAVGLTQLLISVAASMLIVNARRPILHALGLPQLPFELPHLGLGAAVLLIVFFLLGYLFYSALFAAVGAMVNTEHEAQQVQLPVAMLLVMSAVFIQPVMMAPESALARFLSVFPFSSPIMMPLRLSLLSLPTFDIVLSLLALVAGCYIAVGIAAKIYRTGLLMYGKRPTLREVVRWVRAAE
ncbi:MAG TPA: ABC transporter permease [Gemmatimonadaceae bacterium]|nr:ABC transporter permease [Gemmatimonadaceae bacterium]